ncbi:unnamed protein product [Nippostrongylus brasiliensis]|uniref:Uncharacterized protein n=1 Tax=Nippostrongylus brasiliensis TaxID=27835 RepID=A0A0N4YAA1_NIPBR|nr:unnamed protein product [Nippostrongylus brasiliensis]
MINDGKLRSKNCRTTETFRTMSLFSFELARKKKMKKMKMKKKKKKEEEDDEKKKKKKNAINATGIGHTIEGPMHRTQQVSLDAVGKTAHWK